MGDIDVTLIVLLYGVLLVSLVCHEASHALFALLGGDRTAYLGGQVTLNPLPHIRREPFGTVILPLGALIYSSMHGSPMCFGYAHAPYDPLWAWRHPRRAALMSAAGPLANLALVVLAVLVLKALIWSGVAIPRAGFVSPIELIKPADGSSSGFVMAAIKMASTFVLLNTLLGILNLVPVPPFDGAGVVEGLFPQTRGFYDLVRSQFLVVIVVLILLMSTDDKWFWPVILGIKSLL